MTRLPSIRRPPLGFAHRGARAHARENTIDAFALALRLGAGGLESDAWLTADGHVVLDHDGMFGPRLRRKPIRSLRRSELPDHVPTLAELYQACGTEVQLSLDVKDPSAAGPVVAVARDVGGGAEGRLWLCHPDLELVASWRELSPAATLVLSSRLSRLPGGAERCAARLRAAGIDGLSLHHSDWNGGLIALVHRFERLALAWDLQLPRLLDELLDAGIDAVYSDHVDRMVEAINRSQGADAIDGPPA